MKRQERVEVFTRHRVWRVDDTFHRSYFLVLVTVASMIIDNHCCWSGDCFAFQWIQKLKRLSHHRLNKDERISNHLRFYNLRPMENMNMTTSTTTCEINEANVENSYRDVDSTFVYNILSSSASIETTTKRVIQASNNNTSWYRAYQQILALSEWTTNRDTDFDEHMTQSHDEAIATTSTNMVVQMTFDAFVRRLLQNHRRNQPIRTDSNVGPMEQDWLYPTDAIEDLFYKIYSTNTMKISPSLTTIESIWSIYQYEWDVHLQIPNQVQTQGDSWMQRQQQNTLRRIHLLLQWMDWSKQYGTLLYERPPPVHLIVKFVSSIPVNDGFMSSQLWSLYQRTISQEPLCPDRFNDGIRNISQSYPRIQLDSTMLQILSKSGLEWERHQCPILQSAIRSFCKTLHPQEVVRLYGGTQMLWRALHAAAQSGRVTDTVWVSRLIRASTTLTDHQALQTTALRLKQYESLLHSNVPQSLRYMEQYLWENQNSTNGLTFNSTTCKMLLTKFSKTKTKSHHQQISIGRRAERFLYRAHVQLNGTLWHPDVECAYCVVEAYLPLLRTQNQDHVAASNSTQYLLQLRMVDHFIRQFIQQFGLCNTNEEEGFVNVPLLHSYKIFARLLDAYHDVALLALEDCTNRKNSILVAQQADTLFRYFMIQYRNKKIDASMEYPNGQHLEQLRSIFDICDKATMTNDNSTTTSSMIRMKHLLQNIDEYKYLLHNTVR